MLSAMKSRDAGIAVLVVAGLGLTALLTWRSLALLAGDGSDSLDLCSGLFASDCDAALADPDKRLLGIPLSGWGLEHFSVLALSLVLGMSKGRPFEPAVPVFGLLLQ